MNKSLTVLGVVALVLGLTGVATASHLHRVFSKNIVNGTIRSVDVRNSGLLARDLAPRGRNVLAQLPSPVAGYEVVGPPPARVTGAGFHDVELPCPDGKIAISGGLETLNNAEMENVIVRGSHPADINLVPGSVDDQNPSGIWHASSWEVEFTITQDGPEVQPFVLCQIAN